MNTGKLLIGVLAGMAAGAALGVLFAPDSGTKTRKGISKKGEDYLAELECRYDDFLSMLTDRFTKAKDEATGIARKAESKAQDYKNNVRNTIEESVERFS